VELLNDAAGEMCGLFQHNCVENYNTIWFDIMLKIYAEKWRNWVLFVMILYSYWIIAI